jgi:hypothetical protein
VILDESRRPEDRHARLRRLEALERFEEFQEEAHRAREVGLPMPAPAEKQLLRSLGPLEHGA